PAPEVQNRPEVTIRQIDADPARGFGPGKDLGETFLPKELVRPDINDRMEGRIPGTMQALNGLSTTAEPDIFAMMALFQEIAQEMRNAARTERQASMDAQVGALHQAADKIKEAAEARFKGALAQGISQIIGGAISVG